MSTGTEALSIDDYLWRRREFSRPQLSARQLANLRARLTDSPDAQQTPAPTPEPDAAPSHRGHAPPS